MGCTDRAYNTCADRSYRAHIFTFAFVLFSLVGVSCSEEGVACVSPLSYVLGGSRLLANVDDVLPRYAGT